MDGKRQKEGDGGYGQDGVSWMWIEKPRKKEQVLLGSEGRGQWNMPLPLAKVSFWAGSAVGRRWRQHPAIYPRDGRPGEACAALHGAER